MDKDRVVKHLNHLLGILRDGEKGYREAADEVDDSDCKAMFMEYARQRGRLAQEVVQEVRRLGGEPHDHSSAGARLQRAWTNVREAVTGKDDYAVVAEVERGEEATVDAYREVLKEALPAEVETLVGQQHRQVEAAHGRVRDLKRSLEASR